MATRHLHDVHVGRLLEAAISALRFRSLAQGAPARDEHGRALARPEVPEARAISAIGALMLAAWQAGTPWDGAPVRAAITALRAALVPAKDAAGKAKHTPNAFADVANFADDLDPATARATVLKAYERALERVSPPRARAAGGSR